MRIGFDAKRAFHNSTGLGHYSRTLIRSLATTFREHEYYLLNTKPSGLFNFEDVQNAHEILPENTLHRVFPSAWRSKWVTDDLKQLNIHLYHGLSHEIPVGIREKKIPSVVTMHDLIHERYPGQYKKIDVNIYRKKFRYACKHADLVIAISQQTKKDLIEYYHVQEDKIRVCYQSCNPAFSRQVDAGEKEIIKKKYNLPDKFFLYVGSVIERKNLLNICKAIFLLRNELQVPLVVIGEGKGYMQVVKDYVKQQGMGDLIIFLSENPSTKSLESFKTAADFPGIYQQALAMIYPSFFEGFGIPVLEALFSRLPVITSNVSCLPEAGGDAALYVNPNDANEIGESMKRIYEDEILVSEMKEKGWQYAQNFTPEKCAASVMNVYNELVKEYVHDRYGN
ncbi:MAG: glycosyltransferase family 4 protein [Chitinophagaceae bacterium]|jgi:glycosyltransferase involved in cell wall biosynthesis|nr:glycosyltransferase family 4 protein [Chitinophagaceae bacterium]